MKRKRFFAWLLAMTLIFTNSSLSVGNSAVTTVEAASSTVTEVDDLTSEVTYNAGDNDYKFYNILTYYDSPTNSYLTETDDGLMRVEYYNSKVIVEYYDSDYNVISKKYVEAELSEFGGFYAGDDAYYLVFGQSNYDEDDSVEVIRVVKYSTDWKRQGQASLYGANTYIPFDAGSCSMAEYNGYLYIRTCHKMYESSDGLHHQANMVIVVEESSMKIADSQYDVSNYKTGYVSHSFNQFIILDDEGNLIALDHGDANPRAAMLFKYTLKSSETTFSMPNSYVNVFSFKGSYGQNYTGASLGGLEYSSSSYIVAGSSVAQDDDWGSHTARNIFITVTDRDDFSSDGTTVRWITDYDTDGDISASAPQLVKMSDDLFLLLWTTEEHIDDNSTIDVFTGLTELHYLFIDGEGNDVSKIYTVEGQLSDCQPIVSGDAAIWYVTGDVDDANEEVTAPIFFSISTDGTYSVQGVNLETPSINVSMADNGITISWEAVDGAEGYYVRLSSMFGTTTETIEGNDAGSVTISTNVLPGYEYVAWVCAYSGDTKSLANNKAVIYYIAKTSITSISNIDAGIQLSWIVSTAADEYKVYRATDDGEYKLLTTTEDTEWTDTSVAYGSTYSYKIYSCSGEYSSVASLTKSLTRLAAPESLEVENADGGVKVTWDTVNYATAYRVFYKAPSDSYYTYSTVTNVSGSATQSCVLNLSSGETYDIYIMASSGSSYGMSSDTVSILCLDNPVVELTSTDSKISIDWDAVTGAEGYKIYRKSENGNYSLVKTTTGTSWTDSSITKGTLYTYQVYAYAGDYVSAGSEEKTGVIKADQTVTASIADSSLTVGDTSQITASGTGTITYSSSDTSVATVSSSGLVTAKKAGTVTVTVKASGNDKYNSATKTITVTVKEKSTNTGTSTGTSTGASTGTSTSTGTGTSTGTNTSTGTSSSTGTGTGTSTGTSSNSGTDTETDYLTGDVNEDGYITYLDAMAVLRYDAELITLVDAQVLAGDVNADGNVNSLDAIMILRYDAGLISDF